MSERHEIGFSRVAIVGRPSPLSPAPDSCANGSWRLSPAVREIVGGWLVCLAVAAGCFGGLAAIAPARDGRTAAVIGLDRATTVASDPGRILTADRQSRC
jgi:hypothetical protein